MTHARLELGGRSTGFAVTTQKGSLSLLAFCCDKTLDIACRFNNRASSLAMSSSDGEDFEIAVVAATQLEVSRDAANMNPLDSCMLIRHSKSWKY